MGTVSQFVNKNQLFVITVVEAQSGPTMHWSLYVNFPWNRMLKFEFVICSDDRVLWDQPLLTDEDELEEEENALGHEWNGPQTIPVETMTW